MRPATLITTVLTPALKTDLTDLATFKNEVKISGSADDSFMSRKIAEASGAIQAYCNRIFAAQTIQDQFFFGRDAWPRVVRNDIMPLQLSSWPVISVTSVVETQAGIAVTLVAGTDFLVDPVKGELTRLDQNGAPCHWRWSPATVIYVAGYADIPADVEEAALLLVKFRWYARIRDPAIRAQNSPGVYEASYVMGTGPGGADDMPAEVTAKIDRYRVPVVA